MSCKKEIQYNDTTSHTKLILMVALCTPYKIGKMISMQGFETNATRLIKAKTLFNTGFYKISVWFIF